MYLPNYPGRFLRLTLGVPQGNLQTTSGKRVLRLVDHHLVGVQPLFPLNSLLPALVSEGRGAVRLTVAKRGPQEWPRPWLAWLAG